MNVSGGFDQISRQIPAQVHKFGSLCEGLCFLFDVPPKMKKDK